MTEKKEEVELLKKKLKELSEQQIDLDPDIRDSINKHFWELFGDENEKTTD